VSDIETAQTADTLVRVVRAEFTAAGVRRVGVVTQAVGGFAVGAWVLLTYISWDRMTSLTSQQDWSTKALALLSSISVLLFAALIIAVGSLCRLLADWSLIQVRDRYPGEEAGPH
jgi:uncharacterized membrane-anchored protein